jgi:hypothetical protein
MMYGNKKVTALQLYFVFTLSIGITNHVLLIPVLLQVGKRDSWIGAAASTIPIVIWVCVLYFLIKRTAHLKIIDWLKIRFGRFISLPFLFIVIAVCFLHAIVTLKDIVTWTNVAYLPHTPTFVITLV